MNRQDKQLVSELLDHYDVDQILRDMADIVAEAGHRAAAIGSPDVAEQFDSRILYAAAHDIAESKRG